MNSKTHGLLALTALLVAYVRNFLQYHRYSFESVGEFFGFWFVHYLAICLVGAFFYAFMAPVQKFILGAPQDGKQPSVESVLVSWCLALILGALALFVIAHWPSGYGESLDE